MEYDEEGSDATGSIPEFGAIFMSNTETIEECLSREVFALPYSCADFVKQVKAGMALFLFEFENRQLFGVYQATSDGEMDIVPHGFNYSGKRFPAQVSVKPIWHCSPLSENEFQGAIIENYFSARKFNFGLNEEQVHRLLYLFSARKLKNIPPTLVASDERLRSGDDFTTQNQRRFTGSINERLRVGDEILPRYRGRFTGSTEFDEFKPARLQTYQGKSSGRYDEEERMLENGCNAEDGFCHCSHGLVSDYRDSPTRRVPHGVINTDEIEGHETCNHLDSVLSSDHLRVSPDMRTNAGDRLALRNRSFQERNNCNDLVQDYERLHYMEPRGNIKGPISDQRFFLDGGVRREPDAHDVVRPIMYGKNQINLTAQARDSTSNSPSSTTEQLKESYDVYCRNNPLLDIEQAGTHLHRASKTSAIGFDDDIQTENEFGGFPVANFQCGSSAQGLHHDYTINHDGELLSELGRASANMFGTIRGPSASNKSYGEVVNHMNMGKREVLETSQDLHTYVSHPVSAELPYMSEVKRNLIPFSDQDSPELGHSQLRMPRNIDRSLSHFDDAIITRAIPYTHELAKSVSLEGTDHSHNRSLANFYNLSNNGPSSNFSESKLSGETRERGDQYLVNRSNHQSMMPSTSSDVLMQGDLNTCGPHGYSSLLHRESYLPSVTSTKQNMVEGGKESSSHLFKPSEHQFATDGRFLQEPQYRGEHTIQQSKDYRTGDYHRPRERKLSSDYNKGAPNAKRKSVFSRLRFGPEVKASSKADDTHYNRHSHYVEASADEVMAMLQKSNVNRSSMAPKKLRKFTATWKRRDEQIEMREKMRHSEKNDDGHSHTLSNGENVVVEETRILDFKRRSEAKKNLVSACSDSTEVGKTDIVDEATETSTTKTPPKRRKLIRPVFGKK